MSERVTSVIYPLLYGHVERKNAKKLATALRSTYFYIQRKREREIESILIQMFSSE